MIHYDELTKKLAKKDPAKKLILKVSGMLSPGRDRDGNPKPPTFADGTLVKVNKVLPDGVEVEDVTGKKATFMHTIGARKLELTPLTDFTSAEASKGAETK